jgi:hypothetical protein
MPSRRTVFRVLVGISAALLAGCIPDTMTGPGVPLRLPQTLYYLRAVDGQPLPYRTWDGETVTYASLVADTLTRPGNDLWWSEGVESAAGTSAQVRLGGGKGYVVGVDAIGRQTATLVWPDRASGAPTDSSLWSPDTVVVFQTGATPWSVGPRHRLVFTRVVATDTL